MEVSPTPHTHLPSTSSHGRAISLPIHPGTWGKLSLRVSALVPLQPQKAESDESPQIPRVRPLVSGLGSERERDACLPLKVSGKTSRLSVSIPLVAKDRLGSSSWGWVLTPLPLAPGDALAGRLRLTSPTSPSSTRSCNGHPVSALSVSCAEPASNRALDCPCVCSRRHRATRMLRKETPLGG